MVPKLPACSTHWRTKAENFKEGDLLPKGIVNMASCWYQLGHNVGLYILYTLKSLNSSS